MPAFLSAKHKKTQSEKSMMSYLKQMTRVCLGFLVGLSFAACAESSPAATPPSFATMTMPTGINTPTASATSLFAPQTLTPQQAPNCDRSGTTTAEAVLFPETGELHRFEVYLPPCYAETVDAAYPVLYWTSAGGSGIFEPVDRLIRQGETLPFIAISVDISPDKGYGADAQIVADVVPYIDLHYRTQADRRHRSITGFSHGAAIAARTAFRAPDLFGRVAVLSGGIADGEQEKFKGWILAMPPDQRPAVLIDVGEQDGVAVVTYHLTDRLDQMKFPYTFLLDPGNHHTENSDSHFPEYLKWLMTAQ